MNEDLNHACFVCGKEGFFVWSSSRFFPKDKLLNKLKGRNEASIVLKKIIKDGVPICMKCRSELDESSTKI